MDKKLYTKYKFLRFIQLPQNSLGLIIFNIRIRLMATHLQKGNDDSGGAALQGDGAEGGGTLVLDAGPEVLGEAQQPLVGHRAGLSLSHSLGRSAARTNKCNHDHKNSAVVVCI